MASFKEIWSQQPDYIRNSPLAPLMALPFMIGSGAGQALQDMGNTIINQPKETKTASTQQPTQPTRRNYGFSPDSIQGKIVNAAYAKGVDPALALAVAQHESGFNPNAIGDNGKSFGLFQIYTPAHPGYKGKTNVDANIDYGVGLLANLNKKYKGDVNKVIQAYNAGSGAVDSGKIPAITRNNYLPAVIGNYNKFNTGTSNVKNTPVQNIQTFNQGYPESILTPVVQEVYTNYPKVNLSDLKMPSSDFIQKYKEGSEQIQGTNNMANNNVQNNLAAIAAFNRGLMSGTQTPNIGVTDEEVQGYLNALQQMGAGITNQQQQQQQLLDAYNKDIRNQRIAGVLNGVGQVAQGFFQPERGNFISANFGYIDPGMDRNRVDMSQLGTSAMANVPSNVEQVQAIQAMQANAAKAQQELANQRAKIVGAIRTAQATGLPINVAMEMSPTDYINYLKPIQESQRDITKESAQGVRELLKEGMSNESTLTTTQLNNYAKMLERQAIEEAANYRAQLGANTQAAIADANNIAALQRVVQQGQNAMDVAQLNAMSAQDLERLKQTSPQNYSNVISAMINNYSFLRPEMQQMLLRQYRDIFGLEAPTTGKEAAMNVYNQ